MMTDLTKQTYSLKLSAQQTEVVKASRTDFAKSYSKKELARYVAPLIDSALMNLNQKSKFSEADLSHLVNGIVETVHKNYMWIRVGDVKQVLEQGSLGNLKQKNDEVTYLSVERFNSWCQVYKKEREQAVSIQQEHEQEKERHRQEQERYQKQKEWEERQIERIKKALNGELKFGEAPEDRADWTVYDFLDRHGLIEYDKIIKNEVYHRNMKQVREEKQDNISDVARLKGETCSMNIDQIAINRSKIELLNRLMSDCREIERALISEIYEKSKLSP